jgi:hypothetical protein
VFDGAIFAGGVHRLKDEEEAPPALGIQLLLEMAEPSDITFQPAVGVAFRFQIACAAGMHMT